MNGLPGYDTWKTSAPDDDNPNEAAIDRMVDEISADREKVVGILYDNLSDCDEPYFAMRVVSYAIEAKAVIERLNMGIAMTPWQCEMIGKFFDELKPWADKANVLIRESAESEVEYQSK